MTIGVYRIYIGHALANDAILPRLTAALDATPNFLYRLDRVLEEDLQAGAVTEAGERGAVRVAMTQSHVMLVLTDAAAEADRLRPVEIELARSGFRRRIPVLGLGERDMDETLAQALGCDRIVALEAAWLACAIQELAEEAAAERRQANVIALTRPLKNEAPRCTEPAPMPTPRGIETSGERAVPFCQIVEAFEHLRSSRAPDSFGV